ncbi:MAG: sensor histidine kinase [Bacteroidota bacterium]|nr:sensor histidine kinase [Bacteroidota bacterium]
MGKASNASLNNLFFKVEFYSTNRIKKTLLRTVLFFFVSFNLVSQNAKIDSINSVIRNATNDTTVARAYVSLVDQFYAFNTDTVIPLSNKAISIAEKNLPKAGGKEKYSYLLTKSAAIGNIGYVYYQRGETDKAMEYFKKGLKIQEEINDPKEIANSLNNIATIYFKLGEIEKSLDYFEQGLQIQKKIGVKEGIAYSLNNIGAIYDSQGQIKKALDYYYQGLKLQEELGNKMGMGTSYNNIAVILMKQGETDKAIEYYNKSMKVRQEADDKRGIAQCLNNLGHLYTTQGKMEKALDNYKKSYALYEEIGNKQGIAYSLNNMAAIYKSQQQDEKALEYFEKSLATYEAIDDKKGIATALNNIGGLLLEKSNATKALSYSEKSLEIAKEGGFVEVIRDAHSILSRIDSARGDTKGALQHYKQFIIYRDSLKNGETKKEGIRKQIQYDYEKKESEAKLMQEKKEVIRQEELKRQKITNWSIAGVLTLLLITTILLFNRYRLKQKNKFQQEIAVKQKEQAIAVMETQEQERKRIAEDLHDSLGHLLSTAKLNLQTIPDSQKQYVENSLQLLNQATEEIHNITFNLMPRTLEEEGLTAALQELTSRVTNSGKVKIILQIYDMGKFILEKQSQFNIYRIIQEAVNNILKHAEASEINIQLIGQDNHITIMIEDDGKGFDIGAQKSGRGLKNIVTRSLWLNGNINIDSTPGRGTTITTEIPA